jgi:hypothetical protein
MRLHTSLTADDIYAALKSAKDKGLITQDVQFDPIVAHDSYTHERAYEIQLGAETGGGLPEDYTNRYGKRQKSRRVRNGSYSPHYRFAATWHEWGWFMAEVFDADPAARWGDKSWGYNGRNDFDNKTQWQFNLGMLQRLQFRIRLHRPRPPTSRADAQAA